VNTSRDSDSEEKHRGILAGLEDVLTGRIVSHSQVKEWAATLLGEAINKPDEANK
jgi:hypothetical protein